MNEHKRNEVIAKNEDGLLNQFLDDRDVGELDDPCEVCEEQEVWIEFGTKRMCQDCYENGCEQAEMMAEDR